MLGGILGICICAYYYTYICVYIMIMIMIVINLPYFLIEILTDEYYKYSTCSVHPSAHKEHRYHE